MGEGENSAFWLVFGSGGAFLVGVGEGSLGLFTSSPAGSGFLAPRHARPALKLRRRLLAWLVLAFSKMGSRLACLSSSFCK